MQQKSPKHAVETSIVTVTPEMAEEWLSKNINNRAPSKKVIDTYSRDMASGRWEFNGDSIRFSELCIRCGVG